MPNHVINVVKFKHLKPNEVDFILEALTHEYNDTERILDFNAIIPEPKTKDKCPEDCLVNKDSHVMEVPEKPWFDWYAWHNKYWGTKWDAYDGYTKIGKTWVMCVFNTAWSAPFPIYEALAQKYNFEFEVKYADEDYGSNCGKITYDPAADEYEHYCDDYYDAGTRAEATAFARRLWNTY